jgi:hypothetical protein
LRLFIHQGGIREHATDVRLACQHLLHALQLMRGPNVILIAQRDGLPAAETDGLIKISCRAESNLVANKRNREGRAGGKLLQKLRCRIRRCVVADNDFARQFGLLTDTA